MNGTVGLQGLTEQIEGLADRTPSVSVEDMWNCIGKRSFGAVLLIPSLVALTPVGGIPTVPSILALIVLLISGQIVFGRESLWLPGFVLRSSVSSDRLKQSLGYVHPVARWVDHVIRPRLPALASKGFAQAIAIVCGVLALAVPPLEPFPFAGTPIWIAFALFGLGLFAHDGILVIVAMLFSLASFLAFGWLLF